MLIINKKSFSIQQVEKAMQSFITPLQSQLNCLFQISQLVSLQKNFLTGYILKDFALINPQTIKDLCQVVQLLLAVRDCEVITNENLLEMTVVLSLVCSNFQKHKIKKLTDFYQDCINQLVEDRDFLKNKYFKPQKDKSKIKSRMHEPRNNNQSQMMGLKRSKTQLAQCPICAVQIIHEDICVLSCGHIIHRNCFEACMKEQILNKKFPLKCPFQECGKHIQTQDIQEYLPKDLVDKYLDFSLHNFVDKNSKNMGWCPTAGCSNAFQFDDHTTNFRCPKCKKQYCLKCKSEKHPGISCQQNLQNMNLSQEDKKFMQFVKGSNYKQCPQCKFWVQKSRGCCHMTCRCTYEFCYVCGSKYGGCQCESEVPGYYGSDHSDDQDDQDNQQNYGHSEDSFQRQQRQFEMNSGHSQQSNEKMEVQQ